VSKQAVARTSPGEFIRQVRTETGKVHWPTRKETVATGIMVMIMTLILAFFFFGIDAGFSTIVKKLLSFIG
jgi:preprotein translocase subunit SecE